MEARLAALEASSQELLRGQKEVRREVKCIRETWDQFSEINLPYLKLAIQRETRNAKLREAIIEKTFTGFVYATIVFMIGLIHHQWTLIDWPALMLFVRGGR